MKQLIHRLTQQLTATKKKAEHFQLSPREEEDCQIREIVDKVQANLSGAENKAVHHTFRMETALCLKNAMRCVGGGVLF